MTTRYCLVILNHYRLPVPEALRHGFHPRMAALLPSRGQTAAPGLPRRKRFPLLWRRRPTRGHGYRACLRGNVRYNYRRFLVAGNETFGVRAFYDRK